MCEISLKSLKITPPLPQAYEPAIPDHSPIPPGQDLLPKLPKAASIKWFQRNLKETQLRTVTAQPGLGHFCPGLTRQLPHS